MKFKNAQRMALADLEKLKPGDKVWFCPLLIIPNTWDGDLEEGIITDIVRPSRRGGHITMADLLEPVGNIQCFLIDMLVVPPANIFKA